MIVVADTSPLNYLILIEQIDILPALFGEVVVPRAVCDELLHIGAPEAVRRWMDQPPRWLEVRTPSKFIELGGLDRGENDAILIAEEIRAERLIMDDRRGHREARKRGIETIGTLALLELAAAAGYWTLTEPSSGFRKRASS
jgi:predicted nucleic acid-binding protein